MARIDTGLDLDAIRTFVAVAEGGDFGAAAKRTGLTRSAIGKSVARLETRLGTRLLHRTTRRTSLTTDGALLHDRFRTVLSDLDEIEQSMRAGREGPRGTLRLSTPDAYGRVKVLPVIEEFLRRWPAVDVCVGLSDRTVDVVDEGLDLAIRIGPAPTSEGLVSRVVGRIEGVRCAAPAYLRERGVPSTADGFQGHDLLVFAGRLGDPRHPLVEADAGHDGRVRATCDSAEAIRIAALGGLGIAHLPRFLVDADLRSGDLVEVMGDRGAIEAPVRVIYPDKRHLPRRVRLFIDLLVERLA